MTERARLNYIRAVSQQVNRKKMYKAKKQWIIGCISILAIASISGVQMNNVSASTIHHPRVSNIKRNLHHRNKTKRLNRRINVRKIHNIRRNSRIRIRQPRHSIRKYNRKLIGGGTSKQLTRSSKYHHRRKVAFFNYNHGKKHKILKTKQQQQKRVLKGVHQKANKIHKELLKHIEKIPQKAKSLEHETISNGQTVGSINYNPINKYSDGTWWKPISNQAYDHNWSPDNTYNGHVGSLSNYALYSSDSYDSTIENRLNVNGGPYNIHFEEAEDKDHDIINDIKNGQRFDDPTNVQDMWVKVNVNDEEGWLKASDLGDEFTHVFGENASDIVPENGPISDFRKTNYVKFVDDSGRIVGSDSLENQPVGETATVTPPNNYKLDDGDSSETVTINPEENHVYIFRVHLLSTTEYVKYVYKHSDKNDSEGGYDTTGIIGSNGRVSGQGLNPNYKISPGQNLNFTYHNGDTKAVYVQPKIENTTIHYKVGNDNGTEVGSQTFSGQYGKAINVNSGDDRGLPGGYYLKSNNNGSYYYDNGSHDVIVEPKKIKDHLHYIDNHLSDRDNTNNYYMHQAGSDNVTYNDSRDGQIGNNSYTINSISNPSISRDYYLTPGRQSYAHQAGHSHFINISDNVYIKHKTTKLNVNLVNYKNSHGSLDILTNSHQNGNHPIELFTHPRNTYTLGSVRPQIENMNAPVKTGLPNNKINWSEPISVTDANTNVNTNIPVLENETIDYYSKSNNKTFPVTVYGIKNTPLDINNYPYGLPHGYILSSDSRNNNVTYNGNTVRVNIEPYDVKSQINKLNKSANNNINKINRQINNELTPTINNDTKQIKDNESKNTNNISKLQKITRSVTGDNGSLNEIRKQEQALISALKRKANKGTVDTEISNIDKNINKLTISKADKKDLENELRAIKKPNKATHHINSVYQLNKLRNGDSGTIHGMKVYRIDNNGYFSQYRWLKVFRTIPVYSNILLNHRSGKLRPSQARPAEKIKRVFILQGKYGKYIRYEIKIGRYNYFISGRAHHISNAYIQSGQIGKHRTVKAIRRVAIYNSPHYIKRTKIRSIKPGTKVHFSKVITIGHRGYEQTRLQISRHRFITANKNYVKLI